jgi:Acetyltransferase (GNAT) domain
VDTPARATTQLEPEELPQVIRYDEGRLGTQRTAVLTSYYEEFANRMFVARKSQGNIAGYLIAQARCLGPWVADTPEIAGSLLQHALRLSFSPSPMVLIPEYNRAARLLLEEAGFLPERRWQSMHLGRIPDLRRRQWLYGYTNFYCG